MYYVEVSLQRNSTNGLDIVNESSQKLSNALGYKLCILYQPKDVDLLVGWNFSEEKNDNKGNKFDAMLPILQSKLKGYGLAIDEALKTDFSSYDMDRNRFVGFIQTTIAYYAQKILLKGHHYGVNENEFVFIKD